jgi:prophage antirepressor-like protein
MTTQAKTGTSVPNSIPFANKEHALVKFGLDPNKIVQEDGRYWMTAKEIGKALGYNDPANSMNRLYSRHKDELEPYRSKVKLTDPLGIPQETSIFNTDGMWIIAMFANTPKAKKFRKFVVNMLKALERQEFIHVSQVEQWRKELIDLKLSFYIHNSRTMDWKKYNKIIRYRKMGLTQREAAKLLDISRDTVQQCERIVRQYELKLVQGGA